MKVVLHTHYTKKWQELADIVIPNTQKYCTKNGYDFLVEKYNDGNVDFVKTKTALQLLKDYDVVFCLEADMLITNHSVRIESFIDNKHSFFICNDVNGINGGSFIAVKGKYAEVFLENTNNPIYGFKTEQNYWEVNAIDHPDVKILTHPSINSIPYQYYAPSYGKIGFKEGGIVIMPTHEEGCWQVGDFVSHLPGMTLEKRIELFNKIKEDIIYE